ncbi:adhesion G protein-coupled receptor L2-like [Octopus sinensis]|uniref:Adhesion G protein-coupled receptor L2-like n=1 Tax=Octopus sinensis TaxID=2607531 RepID=A0A6P7TRL8_9MOLL|nr:adhesion G protein-coupled receptor L2-like [Octopus sinensis]
MLRQSMHLKLTIALVLCIGVLFEIGAYSDICSKCRCNTVKKTADCQKNQFVSLPKSTILKVFEHLDLGENNIKNIDIEIIQTYSHLKKLNISYNKLQNIKRGFFQRLTLLEELYLGHNNISTIEDGSFANLLQLKKLNLRGNALSTISSRIFPHLLSLTYLDLSESQIKEIEDGAFLFLPKITEIDLRSNSNMVCGCHLPALVNYTKKAFARHLVVSGICYAQIEIGHHSQGDPWDISQYTYCSHYTLFQPALKCQSCEGSICNDSAVTSCPGYKPMCMTNVSITDDTQKVVGSCRTYKECIETEVNTRKTCQSWADGTDCVSCCSGSLCNKHYFDGRKCVYKTILLETGQTFEKSGSQCECQENGNIICYPKPWNFVFHFVYRRNSTSKTASQEIVEIMEKELSKLLWIFRVEYCGLLKDKEIFTINCTSSESNVKDVWTKIWKAFNNSQEFQDRGIPKNSMMLLRETFCDEDTTSNNGETYNWPITAVGTPATLPCRAHIATRICPARTTPLLQTPTSQDMPSPKCSPFTGVWQTPDMSQCNNTKEITQKLEHLNNQDINKRNIPKVVKRFSNVLRKSEHFKKEEIGLSISLLEKLLPLVPKVPAATTLDNISSCVNDLMNAKEDVWADAEQANGSTSRILKVIEAIPELIPLKEQHVTVSYPNFGFGVIKVDKDTFNGVTSTILYGNHEANTTVLNSSHPGQHEQDIKKFNYISLPKSILKNQLSTKERLNASRIVFSSMRDDMLYRLRNKNAILSSTSKPKTKINSHIISASIPKISVTDLDEPVTISFILLDKNTYNARCVYWDEAPGRNPQWSTAGCNISYDDPGKRVLCSCNHLTNFALLMNVYQKEVNIKNTEVLSAISNAGCGISLACLVLTIILYVSLKNLWKMLFSKILVSLCVSLAITNLIFIAGMQAHAVKSIVICKLVAALLHYFLLVSFMWMAIEAVHLLLNIVVCFKTFEASFIMRASILAWGLPAFIVILTLSINYTNNYTRVAEVCWLSKTPFYAALLTPVGAILAFNIITFVYAFVRIAMMQNFNHALKKARKVRVLGVVGLSLLLGFTWVIAFFSIDKAAEVFQYLFAIFNTLQGTFIFIIYCIYKKDTRDIVSQFIRNQRKNLAKKREDTYDNTRTEGGTAETVLQN